MSRVRAASRRETGVVATDYGGTAAALRAAHDRAPPGSRIVVSACEPDWEAEAAVEGFRVRRAAAYPPLVGHGRDCHSRAEGPGSSVRRRAAREVARVPVYRLERAYSD